MNWVMSNGNKWSSLENLFTDVVFNWAFLFMPFWVCVFMHSPLWCVLFKGSSKHLVSTFFSAQMTRFSFLARSQYVKIAVPILNQSGSMVSSSPSPGWCPRCGIWGYRRDAERSGGSSVTWIKLQGKFDEKLWEWFLPSSCQIELKR